MFKIYKNIYTLTCCMAFKVLGISHKIMNVSRKEQFVVMMYADMDTPMYLPNVSQ